MRRGTTLFTVSDYASNFAGAASLYRGTTRPTVRNSPGVKSNNIEYTVFRLRGYASGSGAPVISAAKLDTGALLTLQSSWLMLSLTRALAPSSRL
jgi:hypothetical protein